MNLSKQSQSAMLWLIIMICGFISADGQILSTGKDSSIKKAKQTKERKSVSSFLTEEYIAHRNKTGIYEGISSDKDDVDDNEKSQIGSNKEWGFYGGSFSFHKDLKGESQKAPVVLFGVRHAWTTKNNPSHRLRYYIDINPLIIVNYRQKRLVQTSPTTIATVGERKTVFGIGIVPVGLQFNWRNSKKFQPYIAGGMGVAIFNKKFPDNRSELEPDRIGNRFQIMPEFGAGVEIRRSADRSYFVGYKYHHMSNGYTAPLNVGYNTNMIYGGMYFQRGAR